MHGRAKVYIVLYHHPYAANVVSSTLRSRISSCIIPVLSAGISKSSVCIGFEGGILSCITSCRRFRCCRHSFTYGYRSLKYPGFLRVHSFCAVCFRWRLHSARPHDFCRLPTRLSGIKYRPQYSHLFANGQYLQLTNRNVHCKKNVWGGVYKEGVFLCVRDGIVMWL